jgi:hypothetical protein
VSRMSDRLPEAKWPDVYERGRVLGDAIVRSAAKSPVIVADDLVEYFMSRTFAAGYDVNLADCPNAAPPFDTFWVEAKFRQHWTVKFTYNDTGRTEVKPVRFPHTVGAIVTGMTPDRARQETKGLDARHDMRCIELHPDARWILDVLILFEREKREVEPVGHVAIAVDHRGQVMGDIVPGLAEIEEQPDRMNQLRTWLSLVLTTVAFVHCRNVKLQPVDPPRQLNKARVRRGKKPLLRYHVLEIAGMKRVLDGEGRAGESGLKQALHICRGHFKTFTADKPLLGRHVGTYWWHEQVRGRSSEGVVVKDYATRAAATSAISREEPRRRHFGGAANLVNSEAAQELTT